jgi:plasmid stabilization system protein ParE
LANVIWTPEALRQLGDVLDYLAEVAPDYGDALAIEIDDAVDSLARFPQMGRVVPELSREDVRELIIDNYRLVYVVRPDGIRLASLFHAAMDVAKRMRKHDPDG